MNTLRPTITVTPFSRYTVTERLSNTVSGHALTAPLTPQLAELFTLALSAGGDRMVMPTLVGLVNSGRHAGLLTPEGKAQLIADGWDEDVHWDKAE